MSDEYDEEIERKLYVRATMIHTQSEKEKNCKHQRVGKDSPFLPIEDSNFEVAEIVCRDCGKFMGFVYRRKKIIEQEKIEYKIMVFKDDPNSYLFKNDD